MVERAMRGVPRLIGRRRASHPMQSARGVLPAGPQEDQGFSADRHPATQVLHNPARLAMADVAAGSVWILIVALFNRFVWRPLYHPAEER